LAVPHDVRNAFPSLDVIGERRRGSGEIRLCDSKNAPPAFGFVWVRRHKQTGSSGADDADGAPAAVQGIPAARPVEVTDDKDGYARAGRQGGERSKGAANVMVSVAVTLFGKMRHQRIDDGEGGGHRH